MFKRQMSLNSGQTRTFSTSMRAAISAATLIGCTYATQAQAQCESLLSSLHLPDTLITAAQSIPAGTYTPPGGTPLTGLPAFCRVTATISPVPDSSIGIEVWLPTTTWNGKYQQSGNHGLGGTYYWGEMAPQLIRGYATGITNQGHTAVGNVFDASWAMGHPEKIIDHGWRAVHELSEKAKLIVAAYYGKRARYAYFNGCSDGGREGLKDAQMFPLDFDGIIAGSAFPNITNNMTASFVYDIDQTNAGLNADPARTSALTLAGAASIAACDALDGVTDGIIRDPRICHWKPQKLVCARGQTTNCLTQGQADAINESYQTVRDPVTGEYVMSGYARGSELQQLKSNFAAPIFNGFHLDTYAVAFQNANPPMTPPTITTFNLHKDLPFELQAWGVLNAIETDLTAFNRNGGKIIEWHGWADQATMPGFIVKYYTQVAKRTPNVRDFYRLFMMPGVAHCGGGPGPDDIGAENQTPVSHDPQHDVVSALEAWRENGVAPSQLIASKLNVANQPAAGIAMQRPICPYPSEAIYGGSGNTNNATNFYCGPRHEKDADDDDDDDGHDHDR